MFAPIDREKLAAVANREASLSRIGGAPRLHADSPRDAVLAWLQWNDRNGCWTDKEYLLEYGEVVRDEWEGEPTGEYRLREGREFISTDEAWAALAEQLADALAE